MSVEKEFLSEVQARAVAAKTIAERAIAQLDDEQFFQVLSPDSNSVALVVKHLTGNFRSRWRDFLTTDGEKEDRERDREFVIEDADSRSSLMRRWDESWLLFSETLAALKAEELQKTITIRTEPHSVLSALMRGLTHVHFHAGQIVFLAKTLRGSDWKHQSIARGESEKWRE